MLLKDVLQKFLNSIGWNDSISHDDEDDTDCVNTGYAIGGQQYDLMLASDEERQWLQIRLMSPFAIPEKRRTIGAVVIAALNQSLAAGAFYMSSNGEVYYYDVLDVEGTRASPKQFQNMLAAGGGAFSELRCAALSAAAYTKQSAKEVIDDLEESIRKASDAEDESSTGEVPKFL